MDHITKCKSSNHKGFGEKSIRKSLHVLEVGKDLNVKAITIGEKIYDLDFIRIKKNLGLIRSIYYWKNDEPQIGENIFTKPILVRDYIGKEIHTTP